LTAEGFLPTELNPRCGAGLQALSGGLSDMPLQTLIAAILAGIDLDYRTPELESLLVDRADGHRAGGTWRAVPGKAPEILGRQVVGDEDGYLWAGEHDLADGWVIAGPSALGAFVRLTLSPPRTPSGPSVASRAVAFCQFADANLGSLIGPPRPSETVG
jgi:hypothetical protein